MQKIHWLIQILLYTTDTLTRKNLVHKCVDPREEWLGGTVGHKVKQAHIQPGQGLNIGRKGYARDQIKLFHYKCVKLESAADEPNLFLF